MPLRDEIDRLRELPDAELKAVADDAEEAVQRGLAAVLTGELWLSHLRREHAQAVADDDPRAPALADELNAASRSTASVRDHVTSLAERTQALGIGAPRTRA